MIKNKISTLYIVTLNYFICCYFEDLYNKIIKKVYN